jgi:hypothetical protein
MSQIYFKITVTVRVRLFDCAEGQISFKTARHEKDIRSFTSYFNF